MVWLKMDIVWHLDSGWEWAILLEMDSITKHIKIRVIRRVFFFFSALLICMRRISFGKHLSSAQTSEIKLFVYGICIAWPCRHIQS